MPDLSRRSLITGLISLVAAPAIVRAGSLMPVKVMEPEVTARFTSYGAGSLYAELCKVTRQAFLPRLFVQMWEVDDSPVGRLLREMAAEQ